MLHSSGAFVASSSVWGNGQAPPRCFWVSSCTALTCAAPRGSVRPSKHRLGQREGPASVSQRFKRSTLRSCSQIKMAADPWAVLSAMGFSAAVGILAEKTKVGAMVSPPIVTMLLTLLMTNVGVLPSTSGVYEVINAYLVPMAVPLLLFNADLRRVFRQTGALFLAFLIAAIGTVLGALVASWVAPMKSFGSDAWKVASMLMARHIGGAVNFVAVADALKTGGSATASALAADNVIVALYFMMLFYFARNEPDPELTSSEPTQTSELVSDGNALVVATDLEETSGVSLNDMAVVLTLSACICTVGGYLARTVPVLRQFGMIPVSTLIILALATALPDYFRCRAGAANSLGVFFMQLFFAASGASGSIRTVLQTAPSAFVHIFVQLAVHFLFLIGVGKMLKINLSLLLISSNASVGGPTTAAAMASSRSWKSLIIPGLLVGVFGYSIATFLGVLVGKFWIIKIMAAAAAR